MTPVHTKHGQSLLYIKTMTDYFTGKSFSGKVTFRETSVNLFNYESEAVFFDIANTDCVNIYYKVANNCTSKVKHCQIVPDNIALLLKF